MHHNDELRDKLVKDIEDMYALENHLVEQLEQQAKLLHEVSRDPGAHPAAL